MALNDIQQLHKILEDSKQILLVFGLEKNEDDIASTLALKLFLEKQNKQVDIVAENFTVPKNLKFLPKIADIRGELAHLQKLTIKVDISRAKIETLSYDIKDNWLSIHLSPKQGTITKNDLRTAQSNFKYDLIIAIGARDLESLGNIFFSNTDLFYKTPVVNIDRHASNEHYGQINLVDITATSVAEIVYKIMFQLGEAFIDENIATCVLTGIISQTHGFKVAQVTPGTLNLASRLMNMGAGREEIIRNLYRTQSISSLKLWGRALSNLQTSLDLGLVWTSITRDDFTRSGADEEDLKNIISELISNTPEARIILLFNEITGQNNNIRVTITADKPHNALELLLPYRGLGNKKTATVILEGKTLAMAEEEILKLVKEKVIKTI